MRRNARYVGGADTGLSEQGRDIAVHDNSRHADRIFFTGCRGRREDGLRRGRFRCNVWRRTFGSGRKDESRRDRRHSREGKKERLESFKGTAVQGIRGEGGESGSKRGEVRGARLYDKRASR